MKLNYKYQKYLAPFVFSLTLFILPAYVFAQSHEVQIKDVRAASNVALKSNDMDGVFESLTEDVLITTGAGTLICGKEALREYIENSNSENPMFWVRKTAELKINDERGLAWESGVWNGYLMKDQEERNSIVHGKYAAMWTFESGKWKIKSQLFVTLQ